MHRSTPAPVDVRIDDRESLAIGKVRVQVLQTPGHTADSTCLVVDDRVYTGDTLLIGSTGRADLLSGSPEALHWSLFDRPLKLDSVLKVFPAHDDEGRSHSTIGQMLADNRACASSTGPPRQRDDRSDRAGRSLVTASNIEGTRPSWAPLARALDALSCLSA